MKICVMSMFYNAMPIMDQYLGRFFALTRQTPQHEFEPLFGEGNSTDGEETWNYLNLMFPGCVHKCVHDGPVYGSVDLVERWVNLSKIWNHLLSFVRPDHDAAIYVEADLLWEPQTLVSMVKHLEKVDMVGPMCLLADGRYYDTWGTLENGVKFSATPPYHEILARPHNGLVPMDAVGACWAMRGEVARTCRLDPPELDTIGFWMDAKKHGYQGYLDPKLKVVHP